MGEFIATLLIISMVVILIVENSRLRKEIALYGDSLEKLNTQFKNLVDKVYKNNIEELKD